MKNIYLIYITILVLTLSACGAGSASTAIPTVVLDNGVINNSATKSAPQISSNGAVTASGVTRPLQEAQLAFALAGTVKKVYVAEGDQVKAGDLLAELDNTTVQVSVDQAQRTVRELTSQAAIATTEQAIAEFQKTYDDAKKKVNSNNYRRADQSAIDYYKAQLVLAQKALDNAKDLNNKTSSLSSADPVRAAAVTNLYNTQKAYNTALSNLEYFTNKPSDTDVALDKANLDAAAAALQEAKWYLAELRGESIPTDATGAQLAQLQQARDNLQIAQNTLEHTRLLSPFSGTVTTLHIVAGEFVSPGQIIIAISDVTNLQVVTTDLSERDISKVNIGQTVTISVEALNTEITGHVLSISPIATTLGGDVVYKTTIALDTLPDGLRAGMSVNVKIQSGE